MNEVQYARYRRQILLPALGEIGQQRLINARVLIIGIGGLGSAVAMYLAAAGVGHLTLSDYDQVDLSNLQRQIAHRTADVGRLKVDSARDALLALNPEVEVIVIPHALDGMKLIEVVNHHDLVVDACDNFETRFLLNRACFVTSKPLVSGAAMGFNGQVAVFFHRSVAPCYQCLYPNDETPGETCTHQGILAPLAGIVGSVQATEALKILTGIGQPLIGRLLLLDALTVEWRVLRVLRDPACPTCGHNQLSSSISGAETPGLSHGEEAPSSC
ncbi:Molybdopterin-synthase adenylyltransferase [Gammaproteobacteria bacterium]